MSKITFFLVVAVAITMIAVESRAWAAKAPGGAMSGNVHRLTAADLGSSSGGGRKEMMLDLSMHYVRDVGATGATDSAPRFSLGGMFNDWLGMDAVGLYQLKSKNYLVGGDFRVVVIDWFYVKGGVGAYSNKQTRALSFTPLASAGMQAFMNNSYYINAESSYFTVDDRSNISFGLGLGVSF